jgi:hypothetical protein
MKHAAAPAIDKPLLSMQLTFFEIWQRFFIEKKVSHLQIPSLLNLLVCIMFAAGYACTGLFKTQLKLHA